MTIMNANQVIANYADQLDSIATAMTALKAVRADNTEGAKAAVGTLTDQVKAFAIATANDDVPVDVARKGFVLGLTGLEAPAGSIKASGNHFAGFRKLLAAGTDIAPLAQGDAQRAAQSEEVTAIKAAKKALNDHAKANKWTAADWNGLLEREGISGGVTGSEDADSEEIEKEARAA